MGRFREALEGRKDFVVTCELVPGRGHDGKSLDNIMRFVEGVQDFPAIHALSLTDNAGGNPALSADVLGTEILARGSDVIVHFSCKDMSRNFIESRAYALQRQKVTNLLVITGDYPVGGFLGLSKPVFDMDSVNALHYLSTMNAGLSVPSGRSTARIGPTEFYLGAVVSPFKWREASCTMQYIKLEKKIRAGARYLVSQLGYDARKHIELLQYVRGVLASDIPILGSVYVLSAGAAELMRRGDVPGCWVSDEMLELLRAESKAEDRGRGLRLERAAKQVAILRGLGYSGAHLEGLNLRADDVRHIVERAGELAGSWEDLLAELSFAPPQPYYLFENGEEIRAPRSTEAPRRRQTPSRPILSANYWVMQVLHALFFVPDTPGYRMMVGVSRFSDRHPRLARSMTAIEHFVKRMFFQCRSCDDCALLRTYYLCPESRCPKGMRVGPCGGSRVDERCEVFPDRDCVWRRIYWRAKRRGQVAELSYLIPPRDWKLYDTGSWHNYFLGRDHSAHPLVPVSEQPARGEA